MTNYENYVAAFEKTFKVTADKAPTLVYQAIPEWDSVGHMELVSELEDTFDIEMETDDIIDFSSFAKGIEILQKYNVEIVAP